MVYFDFTPSINKTAPNLKNMNFTATGAIKGVLLQKSI